MSTTLRHVDTDIAIVGGGVLGLFLLNWCKKNNRNVVLIESNKLGMGQSIASQGMIHGGQRYNLMGKLSSHAKLVNQMRSLWLDYLNGDGDFDLSTTRLISNHQYLYQLNTLKSKLVGTFASYWMQKRIKKLSHDEYPKWFHQECGSWYRLDEPVVDMGSLLKNLAHELQSSIIYAKPSIIEQNDYRVKHIIFNDQNSECVLHAQNYFFCAGKSNQDFLSQFGIKPTTLMQLRPLRQFILFDAPVDFFGHILGLDPRPSMTITTHKHNGRRIWYLGGKIATDYLDKDEAFYSKMIKLQLKKAYPMFDFKDLNIKHFDVDRAEPLAINGLLPDFPVINKLASNAFMSWPIKLCLAPLVAKLMLEKISVDRKNGSCTKLDNEKLKISNYPWES
jgi:glycine/D-amino acid oxidase-like deaminating enzyme|tara:strand:- start:202 stop:1374 length:1173 start_codon:yes stop_codon:yes gene_type:complete